MADDEENGSTEGAGEESASKKKKIILFAILAILLIGSSVGGTMATLAFLKKDEPVVAPTDAGGSEGEEVKEKKADALYYPLKPSYVVNVDARGRRRYLQADLTLLIREASMIESIDTHKPSVDNVVNSELSGVVFEDIKTAEGKELLRLQLTQAMQALFQEEVGEPVVEMVLFTNFVMQ